MMIRIATKCCLAFFVTFAPVMSASLEREIPNCASSLARADDFLKECQRRARYFTRTFSPSGGSRGEKEENSVWFSNVASASHFLMGCTLRRDRTLSFLGLYYTAEPLAVAQANTAPILGIGFDGDVVLSLDGHPVTFVAVQPFDTKDIKTRWSGSNEVALNCHSPLMEDGAYHLMRGKLFVDFSRFDTERQVSVGSFQSTLQSFSYDEIPPSALPRNVIYAFGNHLLVLTSGSILVRSDVFPRACHVGISEKIASSPLLLHQLCRLQQKD